MNNSVLEEYNSWWVDGKVPGRYRKTVTREIVPEIIQSLDPARATAILGTRRVGKTVIMHQIVQNLLKRGVPPRQIVYFSADDVLLGEPARLLPDVVDFVSRQFISETSSSKALSKPTYILVDEIHAIKDWPRLVKRYIDLAKPFVWILTSSAGSILHRGSTETLAGRVLDFHVFPFSLAETATLLGSSARELLQSVADVWASQGIGPIEGKRAKSLSEIYQQSPGYQRELLRLTQNYLKMGGFPEYLSLDNETLQARYFWTNLVERVLYLDVPAIAEIRNPALMVALVRRLLAAGPCLINISELSRSLETTKLTLSEYLRIIESTMLDFILDRYSKNVPGRQPGMKKSVPVDPGLVVALSEWDMGRPQASVYEGLLAEVTVHAWLRRHRLGYEIMHWRKRDKEVDFVVKRPNSLLPVEVKWRDESKTRGLSGLQEFVRLHKPGTTLTVTRDTFEIKGKDALIPLWMLG